MKDMTDQEANEVRTLDVVAQTARVLANRMVAGPEKVRLQEMLLKEALAYARMVQPAAQPAQPAAHGTLPFKVPNGQAVKDVLDKVETEMRETHADT